MSTTLHQLRNTSRPSKRRKLLGRGPGSGLGKTCGRGQKGMGARSGYKRRHGYEGGQTRFFEKVATRGFTNTRFSRRLDVINLELIEKLYNDGETVSLETLREKNFIKGTSNGVKVLAKGTVTKKVTFQVEQMSSSAQEKLKGFEIKLLKQ